MSRIDDLIQELCPSGVEYKQLGDVGRVVRGKRFVKDDMIDAGVPCVHYGEIYTKYGISAVQSISYVSHERARTLRFAQQGDVIMASAGETIEDIGKSVAWLGSEPIAIHDACYAFSSSMDPKFVSYFFASRLFRDQIR
ncbi:restriction endonuclease subunit S, partial [Brachybacterium sp. AOP35-5H-19]